MGLSAQVDLRVIARQTNPLDLMTPVAQLDRLMRVALADGVGANQANMLFADRRTLAESADEDLDLAGSLAGAFGVTLTFARIKAVIVTASDANSNAVQITRPAANGVPLFLAAEDGLALPPGGLFAWVAPSATGVAVTADTGDLINIANGGAGSSVTYDIVIIGANA